jgi:hypothetical protein
MPFVFQTAGYKSVSIRKDLRPVISTRVFYVFLLQANGEMVPNIQLDTDLFLPPSRFKFSLIKFLSFEDHQMTFPNHAIHH